MHCTQRAPFFIEPFTKPASTDSNSIHVIPDLMKAILASTDFSKTARNAIEYAVEIAKRTKARLILFHAYHATVVPAEVPIVIPAEEFEQEALKSLEKIKRSIHRKHGNKLSIECICRYGFPVDEINRFVTGHKIDLVVMGMEGSGYLTEKLIGSITTAVINGSKCPVLAIDRYVKFKNIKKIALACDYNKISKKTIFDPIKLFAQLFKSHVYILNVVKDKTKPAISKAVSGIRLNHSFDGIPHSFHSVASEDVIKGINDFVRQEKVDLVVMIPRNHSFFQGLFKEAHTKKMAFHSKVPLLAIHE